MESYSRVIPRDLFNESKLLKCIGRLCLLIHDRMAPAKLTFEHDDEPFDIDLTGEGNLLICNIRFMIGKKEVPFVTTYNSKMSYPLYAYHDYCETLVFDEAGEFTPEFIELCNTLKTV